MEAAKPHNEEERLAVLRELDVLDTMPEEAIDRITRLASKIVDAPIVLVSLVDDDRQWFKSRVGLDADETPRELAFCAHAILDDRVMVVEDATKDERFADNPLVTGSPDIRFYAGAPLIYGDDVRLGTLCAIDSVPRQASDDELETLRDLAAVVVDEFKLRQSLRAEAETTAQLREQTNRLALANTALEEFAYLAAHDIRAPIKQIINIADLAAADDDPEQTSSYLGMIRRAAVNLEDIVAGYLRLSKLERDPTDDQTCLVSEMVAKAMAADTSNVELTTTGDASVIGDPSLLVQVFTNLIANAGVHAPGAPLSIETSSDGERVTIRVTNPHDATTPIDNSVFQPFRRLNTTREGHGLGLAIVDRVVRLYEGTVSASGSDGYFTVELNLPSSSINPAATVDR